MNDLFYWVVFTISDLFWQPMNCARVIVVTAHWDRETYIYFSRRKLLRMYRRLTIANRIRAKFILIDMTGRGLREQEGARSGRRYQNISGTIHAPHTYVLPHGQRKLRTGKPFDDWHNVRYVDCRLPLRGSNRQELLQSSVRPSSGQFSSLPPLTMHIRQLCSHLSVSAWRRGCDRSSKQDSSSHA